MSRVITFSRKFPSYHRRAGEPTYFVQQIWNAFRGDAFELPKEFVPYVRDHEINIKPIGEALHFHFDGMKYHTIRAGNHWRVGDNFSPRVWSGVPYRSKQISIAPDIQVKKVWPIGVRMRGPYKEFYSGDVDLTGSSIVRIAMNDGLSADDLYGWFNPPFDGQIICWNEKIEY